MERNDFINAVLNSTNGMVQVTPKTDLFAAIEQKIVAHNKVTPATIWWVAASVAVLVALNISAINSKKPTPDTQAISSLASELNNSNQLY